MAGPAVARRPRPPRWRRVGRRVAMWTGVVALTTPIVIAAFVGSRCYGGTSSAGLAPAPPDISGYQRAEAFTFLTVPEWYIVYSTDEYAEFIRRQPPSAFPYLGAIAQYLGRLRRGLRRHARPLPVRAGLSRDARRDRRQPHRRVRRQGAVREHRRPGHRMAVLDRHPRGRVRRRCRRRVRPVHAHHAVVPVPLRRAARHVVERRAVVGTAGGAQVGAPPGADARTRRQGPLRRRDGHGLAGRLRRRGSRPPTAASCASTPRRSPRLAARSCRRRTRCRWWRCRATRRSRRRR